MTDGDDQTLIRKANPNKIPTAVFFIISNEVCERFSFYGLKAILGKVAACALQRNEQHSRRCTALYMNAYLNLSERVSTVALHLFVMVAYALTLPGAILSDSYLGKYHTILYLSIVYVIGGACLSVTAVPGVTGDPPHWWGLLVSLSLIAVGTGGIKPVVSSFLGDQFTSDQQQLITKIFMYFYFGINLGSVCSTLLTPVIRTQFSYYAAFGLPSALLAGVH
jgi:dipeptide/tripeptide permease